MRSFTWTASREVKILMRLPVGKVQTADPMGVRIFCPDGIRPPTTSGSPAR